MSTFRSPFVICILSFSTLLVHEISLFRQPSQMVSIYLSQKCSKIISLKQFTTLEQNRNKIWHDVNAKERKVMTKEQ